MMIMQAVLFAILSLGATALPCDEEITATPASGYEIAETPAAHVTSTPAPAGVSSQIPAAAPMPATAPPSSGAPAQFQSLVSLCNQKRALHSAAPLTWSSEIANSAALSANGQVCGGILSHDMNLLSEYGVGENLFTGSGQDLSVAVDKWYDEVSMYNFAIGGFSKDTGHFTQLVWRGTSQIGCAVKNCGGTVIVSCQFKAPGNMADAYKQNVLAN